VSTRELLPYSPVLPTGSNGSASYMYRSRMCYIDHESFHASHPLLFPFPPTKELLFPPHLTPSIIHQCTSVVQIYAGVMIIYKTGVESRSALFYTMRSYWTAYAGGGVCWRSPWGSQPRAMADFSSCTRRASSLAIFNIHACSMMLLPAASDDGDEGV